MFYKDVVLAERAFNERARGGFLEVVLQRPSDFTCNFLLEMEF